MVSAASRFAFPALAALLSLTLAPPALADAPAAPASVEEAPFSAAESVAEAVAAPGFDVALSVAPVAPAPPAVAQFDGLEAALLARVNADRATYGLAPLEPDPELLGIARTRAAAQLPLPSLSHYDASGKLAVQTMLADVPYGLAGENLARLRANDAEAAERAEVALMNSPLHRKNILEPRFNRLAIGLVRAPDGRLIFAQIFRSV